MELKFDIHDPRRMEDFPEPSEPVDDVDFSDTERDMIPGLFSGFLDGVKSGVGVCSRAVGLSIITAFL